MRRKGRPKKQKTTKVIKVPGKRGRPRKKEIIENEPPLKKAKRGRPRTIKIEQDVEGGDVDPLRLSSVGGSSEPPVQDENYSEGLHMSTMQVRALSSLVACLDCGEEVVLGVRPTTKGMISEFTVSCKVCESQKSTNTPNLIRERKRKREKKGVVLQKNENINYAHVAAFLDNGLGYSGLRHYCNYFNARCLNEATFIVYAKQVISDVVAETEDFLQQNARIVRKAFESQLDSDYIVDLTVGYTTTYHQWGSDFCLVAGAVIELQTGLVLDYDVGNMYCHVCKINAKKIVSMSPTEMTDWFNRHQDTCEIREWCDEIDQDSEEGIKEIDPKYLEAFIAKKMWNRSLEKFGFRYTTLIHESDERIHAELLKAAPYGDIPVIIDNITNCFSRRKSEHARTSFQNKLKAKCPRERVQTKDRIMYVYGMSIPEYNKFAIGSNIKLRELVRRMEIEEEEYQYATELTLQASEILPAIRENEEKAAAELKEIGDAFEMEDEGEEEIQQLKTQLPEQNSQPQQSQALPSQAQPSQKQPSQTQPSQPQPSQPQTPKAQSSKNRQRPLDDEDEEEEAEDEEEEEDDDDEEEEEEDDEEETEDTNRLMGDEEMIDAKDIEVLGEEEEEEEEEDEDEYEDEEIEVDSAENEAVSKEKVSKTVYHTSSTVVRTESKAGSAGGVKTVFAQKPHTPVKSDPLATQRNLASITVSEAETMGSDSSTATRIVISSVERTTLAEKTAKGEKITLVTKTTLPSVSGENPSTAKIHSDSKFNSSLGNISAIQMKPVDSNEPKKIVVTTGRLSTSASASDSKTAPSIKMVSSDISSRSEKSGGKQRMSSTEVRHVTSKDDNIKLVVIEKKNMSRDQSTNSATKKEFQKNEVGASGSEQPRETPMATKTFSENGMEANKVKQTKQPDVVKPFRVDFDDD